MADQLQFRRGNTAQNLAFTGAQAEVTVDTTTHSLVVHDGVTAGGFRSATSAQVNGGTFYYNEDVGSAPNAYLLAPKANTNAPSSYLDGVQFGFVTTNANTGPSTANFQGLGVKSLKYPGGIDPLAGDIFGRVYLIYDAGNDWLEIQRKALGAPPQLRTIGASVGSNAMTVNLAPCVVDFRASSLGSGVITPRAVTTALSLVVPSGATLGTNNATASRIVLVAISAPANVELAVVNLAGSANLDESTLVNTVAITSGSNAASVFYSTVARTGVPFRVLGYIESTQATAGAWASVPSTIQGAGGQALAALSSFGFGQAWQALGGARALGTVYTNTTGRPIAVNVQATSTAAAAIAFTIGGVSIGGNAQSAIGQGIASSVVVPPGAGYTAFVSAGTGTLVSWQELR